MALSGRSSNRFSTAIWPGYVDALSTLLLVLTFVLTIFMVVQFALRDQITTQDTELDDLSGQIAGLADALGLERAQKAALEGQVAGLDRDLAAAAAAADAQQNLIATLTASLTVREGELADSRAKITSFEAQVASLLSARDTALAEGAALTAEKARLLSDQEALNLALATARSEVDAGAEAARLAAARREALDALVADLRGQAAAQARALTAAEAEAAANAAALTEAEAARLADAAAADALRKRLQGADAELTAMTLALEGERKRAEETLTLLAAAEAARRKIEDDAGSALTDAQKRAGLLAAAETALRDEQAVSADSQRRVALLNQQVAALGAQLGSLQALLDDAASRDKDAQVRIETLGSNLNSALAQVASEQKRRADLEEAERIRLEAETLALKDETRQLARYRSDFFAKLSAVLEGREGVRVVGDRFVFSSEVLFQPASADLSPEGREQIAKVAAILSDVAGQIPEDIDWIIRVDGHTDATPLLGTGRYADNWELSQGRALSVVKYMNEVLGFDPKRLAATGFGEYRPVASGDSPAALAANRRIEMKLTER